MPFPVQTASEKAKLLTLIFISMCLGYFLGVFSSD